MMVRGIGARLAYMTMVTPANLESAVCINRIPLAHTTAICHQQNMRRNDHGYGNCDDVFVGTYNNDVTF